MSKPTKVLVGFTIDKSVNEQLKTVSKLTKRSKSNIVDLILTRALPTFIKEPDLL